MCDGVRCDHRPAVAPTISHAQITTSCWRSRRYSGRLLTGLRYSRMSAIECSPFGVEDVWGAATHPFPRARQCSWAQNSAACNGLPILSLDTTLRKTTAMKRTWVASVSILLWATCVYAAGSTRLVKSTPADGSVGANPTAIVLEFSEPVHFSRAFLKRDGGKAEALRDLPQKDATTQTIPTSALSPGHYVLQWEVFTGHTSLFSSHIQFTVSADPAEAPPASP